jgi:hypothetical protein
MTVILHPLVKIVGRSYYLCGRIMTKRQFDSGIEGAPEWTLSGAVYTVRNPPVHLHDVVFIPWVLPIPTLRADGCSDIELVAQISKDTSEVLSATIPNIGTPRYIGAINYTVIVKRRSDWHSKSVHIGEILSTSNPQSFIIRLHAMPFLMAEPDGLTGRVTPIMALIGERPRWAWAKRKTEAAKQKKADDAVNMAITNAGHKPRKG